MGLLKISPNQKEKTTKSKFALLFAVTALLASCGGNTVKWSKGKNAAMDAKIQQLVDTTNL